MDVLQSFLRSGYFSLPTKAERQDHGLMDQVNDIDQISRQNVLVFDVIYLLTTLNLIFSVAFTAGWMRAFGADYGVPALVVIWTALSYAMPGRVPGGVPRRLVAPLPWESASLYHWTVAKVLMLYM